MMLEQEKRDLMRADFEKYTRHILQNKQNFDLESLVTFASSLVNFYIGSKQITKKEIPDASLYLVQLFNGGLNQKIDQEDLLKIRDLILDDNTLNYEILRPIFDSESSS